MSLLSTLGLISECGIYAHPQAPNYDESHVPDYHLPPPLRFSDGTEVSDAEAWSARRRPELLKLFEEHVYGRMPGRLAEPRFEVTATDSASLNGTAVRKEVTVYFSGQADGPKMDILIYLPKGAEQSVPTFVGLNFFGNHSIHPDPGITLSEQWMRPSEENGIVDNRATERSRGVSASRWAVERILARGYGLATIYCGDIDPDFHDGFQNGVHPLFYKEGQTQPEPNGWGTIGAWAWGVEPGDGLL